MIWWQIVCWITSSIQENSKLRTRGEHVVYRNCFWHSEQFMYLQINVLPIFCKNKSFWQRFTCIKEKSDEDIKEEALEDIYEEIVLSNFETDLTENNTFKCTTCNKSYSQKKKLKRHMKTVHSNEEFECNTCNKSYSNKEALKRHLQFVHSNEKFKCSKCNKSYSNKDNLNRHMKFVHVNDKKTNKTSQFKCLICGTTFLHKHSLQVNLCQKILFLHQLTHNMTIDC